MVASFGLLNSLSRCLCWISNIFLVIKSIKKCSVVSFYSVLDDEEVKFLRILKSLQVAMSNQNSNFAILG